MDLDEWELLPNNKTSKEFGQESKDLLSKSLFISPELFVETDYFKCPELLAEKDEKVEEFKDISVSNEFEKHDEEEETPSNMNWVEPEPIKSAQPETKKNDEEAFEGMIEFEKKKEYFFDEEKKNEYFFDEEKKNEYFFEEDENNESIEHKNNESVENCIGFNLWGLRINGIGAICSFGIATAATLCVFVLSGSSGSGSDHRRQIQDPKIQFPIYSDDKRIKEVVQRATRLNQAMAAARGITIPRAQISFGGYYEGM